MMRLKMLGAMGLMLTMIGSASAAVTHVVGGDAGWKLVHDKPRFYEQWTRGRTFGLNDKLVFKYEPRSCKVTMVGKNDYEKCTKTDIIDSWSSGHTVLKLTRPGDYYFVGGTGSQCWLGQRLHVKVTDKSKKPGPDNFDFHFHTVRKDDEDEDEDENNSIGDAAKEAAKDRAKEAAYNATANAVSPGAKDAYDNAHNTYNGAVENTREKAYNATSKAINKTADAATSSSRSLQNLGMEATLLSVFVAMWM